jgi:hypothetical protein
MAGLLSKFDFKLKHMEGKENKVEDSLSRIIHGIFEISISREERDIEKRIKHASLNDEKYTKTMAYLQSNA